MEVISCPSGWISFRASCYYTYRNTSSRPTYSQAEQGCLALGAKLVDIRDETEWDFVKGLMHPNHGHIIGIRGAVGSEGNFYNGEKATFYHWYPNDPISGETCVYMSHGGWYRSDDCGSTRPAYICKKSRSGYYGAPIIYPSPSDVIAYENEDVTLRCQATGDTPIHVAWLRDGQLLQNRTSDTDLLLASVNTLVTGIYKCHTYNLLGADSKELFLEVKPSVEACIKFRTIDDDSRLTSHVTISPQKDDTLNSSDWYAFTGQTSFNRIPANCVPKNRCNAVAPGWLSGAHPTVTEGVVKRKVCFHGNGGCCSNSVNVYIRRCYGYFVYKLVPLSSQWNARYCAEKYLKDESPRIFSDSSVVSRALKGHVFHRIYDTGSTLDCMRCCIHDQRCLSYNHSPGLRVCEMNNATSDAFPLDLVPRNNFNFYYGFNLV